MAEKIAKMAQMKYLNIVRPFYVHASRSNAGIIIYYLKVFFMFVCLGLLLDLFWKLKITLLLGTEPA